MLTVLQRYAKNNRYALADLTSDDTKLVHQPTLADKKVQAIYTENKNKGKKK